jgi:hypothetical protein
MKKLRSIVPHYGKQAEVALKRREARIAELEALCDRLTTENQELMELFKYGDINDRKTWLNKHMRQKK